MSIDEGIRFATVLPEADPPLAETYKNTGPYFAANPRPPASLCEALRAGQRITERSEVALELLARERAA